MSRCSRCAKPWPPEFRRCPDDGALLPSSAAPVAGTTEQLAVALVPEVVPDDPPPGTMIGEYCVGEKLGEGGMASVFAAEHPVIGKRAAIKIISRKLCADRHAVERFIQEARSVNQIGHPNIVDIFAFGVLPQDGRCYLVMEWLRGETLAQRLKRERLKFSTAIELLLQMCDALEAAHAMRIIHRDLKPDNIYLATTPQRLLVKLLDFGIAKLAGSDVTVPRTRSGATVGTAGYMSPEQARGKTVDASTDVYALGVVAFEMILGRLPFQAEHAVDILAQHLAEPPPIPRSIWRDVPGPLNDLLLRMLEKEPAARPSITDVRQSLVSCALLTRNLPSLPDLRTRPRLGGLTPWMVVAALSVAALAASVVLLRRPPTPSAPRAAANDESSPATPARVVPSGVAPSSAGSVAAPSGAPADESSHIPLAPQHRTAITPRDRRTPTAAGSSAPPSGRHEKRKTSPAPVDEAHSRDYTLDPFR